MLKRTPYGIAALLLVLGLLPVALSRAVALDEPLLVIVATSFPATDIPFGTLKEAFRGRSASLDGKRLVPVNHPFESPPRVAFDRLVLKLEPLEVGRFWIDARIRDSGRPPTTAQTSELAIRIVASLANSVSYGTKSMLSAKVKVLTVDGKSANQPGYALAQ